MIPPMPMEDMMPPPAPMPAAPPTDPSLIETRKQELLTYVQNFYRRSWDWRSQSFHEKWDRYDRNYHSIYDPELLAKKEPWQTAMFIGLTVQNVEVITSQLFKTMMAPRPPIHTEAGPAGDSLQAKLIEEVVDYELRKAQFDIAFYDVLKEAIKYGSGFMKLYWERVEDTRRRRVPVEQTSDEMLETMPPEVIAGAIPPPAPSIKGFQMQKVPVLLKNHLCARYVHIRDIFPDPNTTDWKRFIHRDKVSYGTIVRHIQRGEFFDVRADLEDVVEGDKFESDVQAIKHDLGYVETNRQYSKFEKLHTIWEFWGEIPRKWIEFDIPEGDEAEELVPGKVMVASNVALLSSEENEEFDGDHTLLKMDYIRTGQSYGKGIPELILDEQEEINEIRNQRIDNVNLILNKGIAVLESALVNAEQDMVSKPGWILRLKQQMVDDVRKGFAPIDFPDVTASAYRETLEIERGVQERTGANRVTLGSSGEVKDTNQTLGGMELLRSMFNERVAAYGMVIESSFLIKAAEKIYGLIYQKINPNGDNPKELLPILGDDPVQIAEIPGPMGPQPVMVPRYMAFVYVPPEEVGRSYRFKPMGIFTLENKTVKAAQAMDLTKLFMGTPFFDAPAAGKYIAKVIGIDEAEKWFKTLPGMPGGQGLPGLPGAPLPPPGQPGGPPPPPDQKGTPGMKGGKNGNQPSFLPVSPVRREPVL